MVVSNADEDFDIMFLAVPPAGGLHSVPALASSANLIPDEGISHRPNTVWALITYSDDASTGIDRGFKIGQDIDIPAELSTPMQMQQYIRIEYHPHSRRADTIIDLSSSSLVSPRNSSQPQPDCKV